MRCENPITSRLVVEIFIFKLILFVAFSSGVLISSIYCKIFKRLLLPIHFHSLSNSEVKRGTLTKYGKKWQRSYISRLLGSQLYIGKIKYQGEIYAGEHQAIIKPEEWKRVREIAKSNNPVKDSKGRIETVAPLKGILRCGHCDGADLWPQERQKYFYYVCSRDEHRVIKQCPVSRVSAGEMEQAVLSQIRIILQSDLFMEQCASKLGIEKSEVFDMLDPISEFWDEITVGERYRLMVLLVDKAVILNESLEIELKGNTDLQLKG